nr:OmpA family protein [Treponemataceae bacterium]
FGAGAKDSVKISIQIDSSKKIAPVPAWKGRIFDASNPESTVREYAFGQFPPDAFVWNGFDAAGRLAPDAKYRFELSAVDLAGNAGVMVSAGEFELNTKTATVLLSAETSAFSPNGDGVKDTISFTPVLKDSSGIAGYTFRIVDASGAAVSEQDGASALPSAFVWDGRNAAGEICADGTYTAQLEINSLNGSHASASAQPFVLDTVPPVLETQLLWSAFSPDGDGNQDVLPVGVIGCSQEDLWTAEVRNAAGRTVRTYTWNGKIRTDGKDQFAWDGTGEAGNKEPDGTYSIVISSTDAAGNSFRTTVPNLVLDSRETKAYITVEYEGISPNGDNVLDAQKFTVRTGVQDGILSWNFDIRSENGVSVRNWSGGKDSAVPETVVWDGMDSDGNPCEGTFTGTLQIVYQKGNKVSAVSSPFTCTVTPPQLSVRTAPEFFSPDNDGTDDDLFIRLSGSSKAPIQSWSFVIYDPNGKPFWQTSGTSAITEQIVWDGLSNLQKDAAGKAERVQSAMDYPYAFTVSDSVGMTSVERGAIPIDVLVIRDGSVLKMAVPAIIFRSDHADFKTVAEVGKGGLDADKAANNERVLKRIADILNKFKDYKVTIVGHANRVTDNEAEETEDNPALWGPALIPLSGARAEFVKAYLVKSGVSASRLTTEGKGGTELVVDYKDKDNNWKNRRVEFILNK